MAAKQVYNKARYERNKLKPEYMEKVHAYNRALYAKQKLKPEWVARQTAKRHAKMRDPEWAARRKEAKRLYDESVQNDPVKRKKRNRVMGEWRRKNMEKTIRWDKSKREKRKIVSPIRVILRGAKCSAKSRGIEFNIQPEDLTIPDHCPVLGIPIARFLGIGNPRTASIDRIDPKKGYLRGNVRIISWLANRLKSDCDNPEILRKIADDIEANLKANS